MLLSSPLINVDITDERGTTPLMTAAIFERRYCGRLLLQNGANPNLRDINENLALHFAVKRSNKGKICRYKKN